MTTKKEVITQKTESTWKWLPYERVIVIAAFSTIAITLFLYALYWMNHFLRSGQIHGLKKTFLGVYMDLDDVQLRVYLENIPLVISINSIIVVGNLLIRRNISKSFELLCRMTYTMVVSMPLVIYIFRGGIMFWFLLTYLNFLCTKWLARLSFFPILIWAMNITLLFTNYIYKGYNLTWLNEKLEIMEETRKDAPMDWYVLFPMTMLRLISFSMDYYWSCHDHKVESKKVHLEKCRECTDEILCLRFRTESPQNLKNYSLLQYYTYLSYFPLFVTGPIISYNAFISQFISPQKTNSLSDIIKYALRVLFLNLGVFFIFLSLYYPNTISVNPLNKPVWQQFNLIQLWTLGLLELFFLWFKFLVFWRVARLFALLDGVETIENMKRCVVNNYCFESFWRSWHRSFNQWLIRYIFIPLGGRKYKAYNIWVVFTFVAIWHDLELNLLVWAWGICLSLTPEIVLKWYFSQKKFKNLWGKFWWKYVCAFGGALDITLMVSANLIGFGIGWKGMLHFSELFLSFSGLITFFMTLGIYTLATLCMFMIRENEHEKLKGL